MLEPWVKDAVASFGGRWFTLNDLLAVSWERRVAGDIVKSWRLLRIGHDASRALGRIAYLDHDRRRHMWRVKAEWAPSAPLTGELPPPAHSGQSLDGVAEQLKLS